VAFGFGGRMVAGDGRLFVVLMHACCWLEHVGAGSEGSFEY